MPQLDGLRALAAFGVLVHHNWWRSEEFLAISRNINLGTLSVRLFFVLSGFLITRTLLEGRSEVERDSNAPVIYIFYLRRFLRIFPIYYLALAAMALIGDGPIALSFWWHFTYHSNTAIVVAGDYLGPSTAHLWTLSVEEQYYLFWPFIVLLVPRSRLENTMLLLAAVGPASRLAMYQWTGNPLAAAVVTPSCFDTLCLGGWLAYRWHNAENPAHLAGLIRHYCLLPGLALFGMLKTMQIAGTGLLGVRTLLDVSYGLLFVWVIHHTAIGFKGTTGRLLSSHAFVFVGATSYGVYLYHNLIPSAIDRIGHLLQISLYLPDFGFLRVLYIATLTLLVASFSYYAIEKPILRWKHRLSYAGSVVPALRTKPSAEPEAL